MLIVSFDIMSSKKNSHKHFCPGCKLGPLNKFCTGPGTEENEDSAEAIDTTRKSLTSAELMQAVRSLSGQIGKNTAGTECP